MNRAQQTCGKHKCNNIHNQNSISKQNYENKKTRTMNQWNRIDSSEITPHTYSQSFFNKRGKKTQWRKDNLFSKWCWENWTVT